MTTIHYFVGWLMLPFPVVLRNPGYVYYLNMFIEYACGTGNAVGLNAVGLNALRHNSIPELKVFIYIAGTSTNFSKEFHPLHLTTRSRTLTVLTGRSTWVSKCQVLLYDR